MKILSRPPHHPNTPPPSLSLKIPFHPSPQPADLTPRSLARHAFSLQSRLALHGLAPADTIFLVLPSSYIFLVAFQAAINQHLHARSWVTQHDAGALKRHLQELKPSLVLVEKDAYQQQSSAARVAEGLEIAVGECYWNGDVVALDLKVLGDLRGRPAVAVEGG